MRTIYLISLMCTISCVTTKRRDVASYKKISNEQKATIMIVNKSGTNGSGFLLKYKNKQYIITNYHVCASNYKDLVYPTKVTNYTNTGYANVLKVDIFNDLCMLSVPMDFKMIKGFKLARTMNTHVTVSTYDRPSLLYTKLSGRIESEDTFRDDYKRFHRNSWILDIPIKEGMSGSPVLNKHKEVVGVVWGSTKTNERNTGGLMIGRPALEAFLNN